MDSFRPVDESVLEEVTGGAGSGVQIVPGRVYRTRVKSGYLALRNHPSYNPNNEIGHLWNGSKVLVLSVQGAYAWVKVEANVQIPNDWANNCTGSNGYVNASYLFEV